MKAIRTIGILLSALALSACGDKGGDGAASATPDKSTAATKTSSSAAGAGQSAKPSTPPPSAPPISGTGPLAPLAAIGKKVDDGFKSFVDGKDLAASFPNWGTSSKDEAKLKADLKEAGAASGTLAFMEFELFLLKGEKVLYYLRTAAMPSDATFIGFSGRAETKIDIGSNEVGELTGELGPFKTAADSVFAMVKGPDCEKVPLTGPSVSDKVGADFAGQIAKEVEKAKASVPTTCKEIAGLGADKFRVRVDDLEIVVKAADGKAVGGVGGSFELKDGKLTLALKGFRAPKK